MSEAFRMICSDRLTPFAVVIALFLLGGCRLSTDNEVVVYTALDVEFSEPILNDFERDSGISSRVKYDVESTKTVGLVNLILNERQRPRCDVFWNNEILHTLRLRKEGLLDVYQAAAAKDFPGDYRASDGTWYGFAARARVLVVNTDRIPDVAERPASIHDLVDPKWKGRAGVARPLFGTTATHAAVLFAEWGKEKAQDYYRRLRDNADVVSGNKQVAVAVGRGQLDFGITDTDDAIIELEKGRPVAIVFPDQGEDGLGTLFIPNTVCILKNCPHPRQARELVEYLLSPNVEKRLAEGPSAQFPVNPEVSVRSRVESQEPVRWMDVDFDAAAEEWDEASRFLRDVFERATVDNS